MSLIGQGLQPRADMRAVDGHIDALIATRLVRHAMEAYTLIRLLDCRGESDRISRVAQRIGHADRVIVAFECAGQRARFAAT